MSEAEIQSQVETTEKTEISNEGTQRIEPQLENQSFIDLLPEDLRAEASLQDFKDVAALAKSYVHAQRLVGKSVRIPDEDASDEAKQEFYDKLKEIPDVVNINDRDSVLNRLGRPESADKYDLTVEIGEEGSIENEIAKSVIESEDWGIHKEAFYNLGLTQEQAKGVLSQYVNAQVEGQKQYLNKINQSEEAMKSRWGEDYDNRLQSAKLVLNKYKEIYPDSLTDLTNGSAGTNPIVLDVLSEYGKLLQESGSVQGKAKLSFNMTPSEALDKIEQRRADPGFMAAYHDSTHPGHDKAVEDLRELYRISGSN